MKGHRQARMSALTVLPHLNLGHNRTYNPCTRITAKASKLVVNKTVFSNVIWRLMLRSSV